MLFAVMSRIVLILLGFALYASSCSDEFNDPNPDYQEIIDNENPTIDIEGFMNGDTLRAIDTLDIRINFEDNYALESMSVYLAPINVVGPTMNFSKLSQDSVFALDTFYVIPAGDTVGLGMLTTCKDLAGNVNSSSIDLTVIK